MRTLITLLMALLFAHAVNACPIYYQQNFQIIDAATNKPISNVSLTILNKKTIVRHFYSDSNGKVTSRIYSDEKLNLVVHHERYNRFETTVQFHESRMNYVIKLSNTGKSKMIVKESEERTMRTISCYSRGNPVRNNLQAQQAQDITFNTTTCRFAHADRLFESYISDDDRLFNSMLIYPNPANRESQIVIESKYGETKLLRIYDLSGTLIYSGEIVFHALINPAYFTPGMYIVKIIDSKNDDVTVSKLLIK